MEAGRGEKLERGEDAPVDPPGPYVAPPAVVDADPRVREHARGKCLGAQSLHARAFRGEIAGGVEQPPAIEQRPGIDPRRSVPCGTDLEEHVRKAAAAGVPDAPEDRAGDHARP